MAGRTRTTTDARRPLDPWLAAVAAGLGLIDFVLIGVGGVYGYRNSRLLGGEIEWAEVAWGLWVVALVIVGVAVVVASPRLFVGWGLLLAGLSVQFSGFAGAYVGWARLSGSSVPLSGLITWLGLVSGGVFATATALVVTRLPSGRIDTRMTRLTSRVTWILGIALTGWWGFGNEVLQINTMSGDSVYTPDIANPLALVHPGRTVTSLVTQSLTLGVVLCLLLAIALVLARRRRATFVERRQLRWLGFGLLMLPVGLGCFMLLGLISPGLQNDYLFLAVLVLGLSGVPVSIAVSVLRYRLFEIDRIVSRTVGFAAVALVLGVLYGSLAALPSLFIGGTSDTPSWVVAGSTLSIAALFNPLRRRMQLVVDKRFNRSRYDARLVVDRFGDSVRNAMDLGEVTRSLGTVAGSVFQPSWIGVWLRGPQDNWVRNDVVTMMRFDEDRRKGATE